MRFLRVKLVTCEFLYDRFRNEHGQHVAEIRLHAHARHAGELACHSPGVARRALEHCWLQANTHNTNLAASPHSTYAVRVSRIPVRLSDNEHCAIYNTFRVLLGPTHESLPAPLVLAMQRAAFVSGDTSILLYCARLARVAVRAENARSYCEIALRAALQRISLPEVDATNWLIVEHDI